MELKLTDSMDRILSPLFNSNSSLIYLFGGSKFIQDDDLRNKLNEDLPIDILNFKFLLHPVRLTVTKLLAENVKLTAVEIRGALGITWTELNNQLTAMKKKGLIHNENEFVDGGLKNVVTAEQELLKAYGKLKNILADFLHTASNLDSYIKYTKKPRKSESPMTTCILMM